MTCSSSSQRPTTAPSSSSMTQPCGVRQYLAPFHSNSKHSSSSSSSDSSSESERSSSKTTSASAASLTLAASTLASSLAAMTFWSAASFCSLVFLPVGSFFSSSRTAALCSWGHLKDAFFFLGAACSLTALGAGAACSLTSSLTSSAFDALDAFDAFDVLDAFDTLDDAADVTDVTDAVSSSLDAL